MVRTRSEYRLTPLPAVSAAATPPRRAIVRVPEHSDRAQLATAILDAYRGTIDDEGEDLPAARGAVDDWLSRLEQPHSVVLKEDGQILAVSFVVDVAGRKYIDPVATVSRRKRDGLGRAAVEFSLRSLYAHGVHEVGAVITDGNIASEQLFADLGFVRVGAWA